MGVEYYLACDKCCEFFDLHKWPVIDDAGRYLVDAHFEPGKYPGQRRMEDSPYPFVDLSTHCKKLVVTAEELEAALSGEVRDFQYIRDLYPIVRDFAARHRGHLIFLSCDIGDGHPWLPEEPGFADWLELPGTFQFHQYLPRNLIDVEGLQTWDEVLARHGGDWPFQYAQWPPEAEDVEIIRAAFEQRWATRRMKNEE